MSEYRKAKDGLGDTPDTEPELLYAKQHETLSGVIMTLCSDGPIVKLHSTTIYQSTNCQSALLCVPGTHQSFQAVYYPACCAGPSLDFLVLYPQIYRMGYRPLAGLFFTDEERLCCARYQEQDQRR